MINFCLLFPFFLFSISHSNVIHREICVKDFSRTSAPRISKFGTNVGYDFLYCVKENQHAATYHSPNTSSQNILVPLFSFFLFLQLAKIKNLILQNCFNIPLMAMAGGMWALLTLCYIKLRIYLQLKSGVISSELSLLTSSTSWCRTDNASVTSPFSLASMALLENRKYILYTS